MKVVILAGGFGTRISEESSVRPKPMVEIGGQPILWHIMKIYLSYGLRDFVICLGYKGDVIKDYFANYYLRRSDITIDFETNTLTHHSVFSEPWRVTLVDTGQSTMTGGRLKRVADFLDDDENFCMTYGDGVANIDIGALIQFHEDHGKIATLSAVAPPGRFGALSMSDSYVDAFSEKPKGDNALVNGGFFVLSKKVMDYLPGDDCIFENQPLEQLAKQKQLKAYHHDGFWQPMDTLRDKRYLEMLWDSGAPPWRNWD